MILILIQNFQKKGFPVIPGHINYISLTATSIDADEDIRKLDPSSRNCLFSDENQGLRLHKKYSQANCILECSLLYAQKSMASNLTACTPWYLPFLDDNHRLCDPWEAEEFMSFFQSINHDTNCKYCLPDCKQTLYKHKTTTEPLRICDENNFGVSNLCRHDIISMSMNYWGSQVLEDLNTIYNPTQNNVSQQNNCTR